MRDGRGSIPECNLRRRFKVFLPSVAHGLLLRPSSSPGLLFASAEVTKSGVQPGEHLGSGFEKRLKSGVFHFVDVLTRVFSQLLKHALNGLRMDD
jgi:hypothetical protein